MLVRVERLALPSTHQVGKSGMHIHNALEILPGSLELGGCHTLFLAFPTNDSFVCLLMRPLSRRFVSQRFQNLFLLC